MLNRALLAVLAVLVVVAAVGGLAAGAFAQPRQARQPQWDVDAVYHSGNIYTMDPVRPRAEALAVSAGRLLAVGSDEEVLALATDATERIDLEGRTVLPGLIDAHGHMAALGAFNLGVLDLSDARNFDDIVARVAAAAQRTPEGEWILGGRWDHESWESGRGELPTHQALSKAVPNHPVWLSRVDGHAGIANARAMEIAGVSSGTADPEGGELIRGDDGEPTGVFIDNAERLIARHIPEGGGVASTEALILAAQQRCLSVGLTGVHDAGVSPGDIGVYESLAADGRLKVRIYAMVHGSMAKDHFASHEPYSGERLSVRAAKLFMDGALGSRGAWLFEPYADRPLDAQGEPYTGLNVSEPAFIEEIARDALRRGYQVCTHAIGDRANHEVLDAYANAIAWYASANSTASFRDLRRARNHRFRIEHAQILDPADIPRFAQLGVIASMQQTHATTDMRWAEARLGPERLKGAYAWASLLRSGARLAGGSDFPVESHNPLFGLYAAVTRQDQEGQPAGGWLPQERMTREEALRSMTLDAAYAAFEEDFKGSLANGRFADFIVIDRDVMTCDVTEIPGTKVLRTVIGGELVYSSDE